MRNMSFAMTKQQIIDRTKTVTRRLGWQNAQPGELLRAVEKSMGLKKGEKIRHLATIRVLSVRREPLRELFRAGGYGPEECTREGFGAHPKLCEPSAFVDLFCRSHKRCIPDTEITRIEFEYAEML